MITVLDNPTVASAEWRDLIAELNRWGAEGRMATLWWRDDDATAPCRQLDDLLTLADGVPVALAVIPGLAEAALASWLKRGAPKSTCVLQHGWRHTNHDAIAKESEFPSVRSAALAAADLLAGRERLTALFGTRALAVLVPPWNRFDQYLLRLLPEIGFTAISRIKPRDAAYPRPGIFEVNVHLDLVEWRGRRRFVGETAALHGLVAHLRARRCGTVDADEPTGILTHHLVQDQAASAFVSELIDVTRDHPAARWLDAKEIFAPGVASMASRGRA
jgi:hypothetical protein